MDEGVTSGLIPAEEISAHDYKLLGPGMPALLLLHEYGDMLRRVFGRSPILCGSVFTTKHPRDVDVRLVLLQSEYREHVGPIWEYGQPGTRWALTCAAFALLGQKVTGLNIDFQVQNWAHAAHCYPDQPFIVLGHGDGRTAYPPQELRLPAITQRKEQSDGLHG